MSRRLAVAPEPPCPNEAEHTPTADDMGPMEWASKMARTHDQVKCAGCGLYKIWTRRPPGSLAPCWWCTLPKVDPATLRDGDDPICPGCRVEIAQRREAERQQRVLARWADAT